jgi:arylsulfatase A-like enzyme
LGETDEFAHSSRYDAYLQQATMVDKMIADLWYYVQTDPFYKDNTTFIITTDHGRGSNPNTWKTHNLFIKGSGESWLAMIGPGIHPDGEMDNDQQIYSNQLVATIAQLLGKKFETTKKIGKPIPLAVEQTETVGLAKNR